MKKRELNIFDAGIAFLLGFILAQFISVIGITISQTIMDACGMSATQISNFWDTAAGSLLQTIFMDSAFVLVFVWYYSKRSYPNLLTKPTKPMYKYIGICVIIGVASMFLLSGVLNYFQLLLDKLNYSTPNLSYSLDTPSNYLISLVSLALIPAICEELLFRGVIVNALKSKGEIFAIIVSSLMFAIFHFSPAQLIYPICFGLILAIVYLRTNNLLVPILLHFVNNALTVSIQYFSSSSGTFTHSSFNLIYAIVTFIAWIFIMRYLFKDFIQYRKLQAQNNANLLNSLNNIKLEVEDNCKQPSNTTATKAVSNSNNTHEQKFNNSVFYGSIGIMLVIYVILLFV